MTAKRYRKRPVEIEALQWTGNNGADLQSWCGEDRFLFSDKDGSACLYVAANDAWLDLEKSEWIAKDRLGFYPIKNDMFHESYESVE